MNDGAPFRQGHVVIDESPSTCAVLVQVCEVAVAADTFRGYPTLTDLKAKRMHWLAIDHKTVWKPQVL